MYLNRSTKSVPSGTDLHFGNAGNGRQNPGFMRASGYRAMAPL